MKPSATAPLPAGSKWHRLALAIGSGIMLGLSFPPSPIYSMAYVSLIPLLLLIETLEGTWRILRYSYLTFLVFHLITIYWIGGFVIGKDVWLMLAGAAVLFIHPFFYMIIILLYSWVRRRLGLIAGLMFLPVAWVSYEFSHSLSEISFPWLSLGNSQAFDLQRIQIAEFTSTYGVSFLILCFNIIAFIVTAKLATRSWSLRSRSTAACIVALVLIYFGPWIYGEMKLRQYDISPSANSVRVGVVQPNIDPWEKWGGENVDRWTSYEKQLALFLHETRTIAAQRVDLVVWPETAIPFRILLPGNQFYWSWLRASLDSIQVPVLTGLPSTVFYDSASAPITASRDPVHNRYYDDFNSTALLIPGRGVGPIYKKIVLVPFAERIPYAESFKFLIEPLKWNVGIGMWGKGQDTVVYSLPLVNGSAPKFASMICYESVYPNFVREFVKRGAQFLVILTNDSWWGNTSGAYQHAGYGSFRAVENRRWIIRAANGGISGLIDPTGTYHQKTSLYTTATFHGTINLTSELTFYTKHGDVFALGNVGCMTFILLLTLIPQRRQSEES
jgi:apolipoprotein N-acyltransferase